MPPRSIRDGNGCFCLSENPSLPDIPPLPQHSDLESEDEEQHMPHPPEGSGHERKGSLHTTTSVHASAPPIDAHQTPPHLTSTLPYAFSTPQYHPATFGTTPPLAEDSWTRPHLTTPCENPALSIMPHQ